MPRKSDFTYDNNLAEVKKELEIAHNIDGPDWSPYPYKRHHKDILIVVRDQLEYLKNCIQSICVNTPLPYKIYLWDNASKPETADFISHLAETSAWVESVRVEENQGFIIPNNRLAAMGSHDYIILLNSDTVVRPLWSEAMIGWLRAHPNCAEVGYLGGWLDEQGRGHRWGFGSNVDYLCGWGVCISRKIYREFGLFDEDNLAFAYGEDSDLSLRLRDAGKEIYALHADLVVHYENKTINEVRKEMDINKTFEQNHAYIRRRWAKYLAK